MSDRKKQPLIIKFSGGLTAQLLALMSAIYLSGKLDRPVRYNFLCFSISIYFLLNNGFVNFELFRRKSQA